MFVSEEIKKVTELNKNINGFKDLGNSLNDLLEVSPKYQKVKKMLQMIGDEQNQVELKEGEENVE